MKTLSLAALTLTLLTLTFAEKCSQVGFAQPALEIATSRPITETELESLSNLWKTEPPVLDPILKQSFAVHLAGYGNVYFLSFFDQDLLDQPLTITHWLVDSGQVRQELPFSEQLIPKTYTPLSLDAVVFTELNFDGLGDIYTISSYITGIGSTGAIPFPVITLYEQQEEGSFVILEEESLELTARGVSTAAEVERILREELLFLP
ncbi:MAG: hypothetical protein Q6L68_06795 [Thermostichus sp. DG02_5_bins_236]